MFIAVFSPLVSFHRDLRDGQLHYSFNQRIKDNLKSNAEIFLSRKLEFTFAFSSG